MKTFKIVTKGSRSKKTFSAENICYGPVRNVLSPPPRTVCCGLLREKIVFFFNFDMQKMQNGLKRMFLWKKKNFGSKGKTHILVADRVTPLPRLRTGFFFHV